jgi:hypothetical protein
MSRKVNIFRVQPPLLFDQFTGAAGGYSFRKLRTGATLCCRIRRSSDNAEQNIGFLGREFDSVAALAFCGAGSGFITTWYDQTTNGRNSTQTSATLQPRIINAGVLDTQFGKAAIKFDGVNDFLDSGDNFAPISGELFIASVGELKANGRTMYSKAINALSNQRNCFGWNTAAFFGGVGTGIKSFLSATDLSFVTATGAATASAKLYNQQFNVSTNRIYQNNVLSNSVSTAPGIPATNNSIFRIGIYSTVGQYNDGLLSELVIWQSAQAANLSGINTNINNYYGIY